MQDTLQIIHTTTAGSTEALKFVRDKRGKINGAGETEISRICLVFQFFADFNGENLTVRAQTNVFS